jgi:hypothetical protein
LIASILLTVLRDTAALSETRVPRYAAPPMVAAMTSFRGGFE